MSGTDRGRRGRTHSDKDCPESVNDGCNACVTGDYKRPARRRERASAKRTIRKDAGR